MAANPNEKVEIRCEVPRWVANILDAESMAAGRTRTQEAAQVLIAKARERKHAYILGWKLAGSNPNSADDTGSDSAWADTVRGDLA
jgi:hypothetical protein